MVLAVDLTINLFNAIVGFAGLIIVLIGFLWKINASIIKMIDSKADISRVKQIETDMECIEKTKADAEYVKELNRATHHRIDDNAAHTLGILNQIQSNQDTMQKDLKEILKTMPRK